MSPDNLQIRRATVDDIAQLVKLWQLEQLPWENLERRFTEFQVVVDSGSQVHGAVGLQIASHQACLHSEAYFDGSEADQCRELFWKRLESLGHNHGLIRVWTLETAPFWHGNGFHPANSDQVAKLPPVFGDARAPWHLLEMRSEPATPPVSVEKEFEVFQQLERQQTEDVFRRARWMRTLALILAGLLFVGVLGMLVYLVRQMPGR